MQNTIKYFADVIKSQGLSGLLAIIIWVYGSQYAETLVKIQEQIVEIRIELASINERFAEKEAVRKMIDDATAKHLYQYHNIRTNSNN